MDIAGEDTGISAVPVRDVVNHTHGSRGDVSGLRNDGHAGRTVVGYWSEDVRA